MNVFKQEGRQPLDLYERIKFKYLFGKDSPPEPPKWWESFAKPVAYVETDGTAYIDTKYVLQYAQGTTKIGVTPNTMDRTGGIYGFIQRSGDLVNRVSVGFSGVWFVGSGTTIRIGDSLPGERVDITWDRKNQRATFNGIDVEAINERISGVTYTAYLGSRNDNGKPDADGAYNLDGKIHYLQEYVADVAQIDIVPVQVIREYTDNNGVTWTPGQFILVNQLIDGDVPRHYGTFTGG